VSEAICDGFDQGYSYEQVVDGVKQAGRRYGVSMSDEDARWTIGRGGEHQVPRSCGQARLIAGGAPTSELGEAP